MSDRFKKWMGKLPIEVDGEKLELDMRMKDKQKLLEIVSTLKDNKNENEIVKYLPQIDEISMEILKRSYPEEDPIVLERFLADNSIEFMQKLFEALKWSDVKAKEKVEQKN